MKTFFTLLALILIVSCQKSTLGVLVKDTWSGTYVRDSVFASSEAEAKSLRFNCPGDFTWDSIKVESYNHGEPQSVATTWQEISPGDMKYIMVREVSPGLWERFYFNYKKKIAPNG